MSLRNLSIAPRAALSFALITALLIFTGLFSLNRMANIQQATRDISENWLPSVRLSSQLNTSLAMLRLDELSHTLSLDEPSMRSLEQQMQAILDSLGKTEAAYEKLISSPEERQLFQRYQQDKRAYLDMHGVWLPLSRANKTEEAFAQLRGAMADTHRRLSATAEEIVELNSSGASQASGSAASNYAGAVSAVIACLVCAGLLTVALAWLLTRSITRPLGQAVQVAETVAKGDLTAGIDIQGKDEPAQLLAALQRMQQQLRSTIQQIGNSSTQLASAAEQLSAVTEESNRALLQQNDEIQMAATAVNEMTAAVEEVARNASSTSDASRASEASAQAGRDRVMETVQAIRSVSAEVGRTSDLVEGLATQAQSITKVLDVIRAIAEQTNLLALNAAIEAARAGEQGRGFAVVADEVRALAHRTQESTREIEQMISSIQNGTSEAVSAMGSSNQRTRSMLDIAEAAGAALQAITEQVSQINERTLVIASAAEEQAQVAREVDRNLVNIRDIAEQSATGANETAASSNELSRLAVELNNMVARFVV